MSDRPSGELSNMIRQALFIASIIFCVPVTVSGGTLEGKVETCVISTEYIPGRGEVIYRCTIEQCTLNVGVLTGGEVNPRFSRFGDGKGGISIGYSIDNHCRALPYSKKVTWWAFLLMSAQRDGRLEVVKRVGPGPGPAMCEGDLRARLITTTSMLLSDERFVRENPDKIDKTGMFIKDLPFLWERAGTFDEYLGMFRPLGYELVFQEYDGVFFDVVNEGEILQHDATSKVTKLKIPCNGMTYFSPKP